MEREVLSENLLGEQGRCHMNTRQIDNKWIVGAVGGLIGGMVLAMWEMMVEAIRSVALGGSFWGSLSTHAGFWSAPQWIGATVIRRLQDTRNPNFDFGPLILGLMGHMMNSIILGLIFVAFAYFITRSLGGLFITGMMYGAVIFAITWWGVVAAIDPAMQEVNGAWFFVGHLMYGGVLGLVVGAGTQRIGFTRRQPIPA